HSLENPQALSPMKDAFSRQQFGDFAAIFNISRRLAASFADEEVRLRQVFDELNIDTILVPSTLGDTHGIIEARQRIKNFMQKVNLIQATCAESVEKELDEASRAHFRDGFLKKEFVRSFESGLNAIFALSEEMYEIDREIAAKTDALLLF